MDGSEIVVVCLGFAAIAGVLIYFFGPRKGVAAAVRGGLQQVTVTVKGGYSPDVVVVKSGQPVRLDFRREETATCSEEVVLPDFGIAKKLPAHQTTSVEFTPERPGEYTYTCGMGMLRGKIVVQG